MTDLIHIHDELIAIFKRNGIETLSKAVCFDVFRAVLDDWQAKDVQALIDSIPIGLDGFIDHRTLVDYLYGDSRQYRRRTSVRMEFQGNVIGDELCQPQTCEHIVLVSDLGQDNDDEMALLLLSELEHQKRVKLEAVVANLRPANRRAALARGTLDILGMADVPVGIGSDGGSNKHTDAFSQFISEGRTGLDYFGQPWEHVQEFERVIGTDEESALSEKLRIYDGQKLLFSTFSNSQDKSLNFVLISSLKDAAMFLRSHEELFVAKVKSVTIMGGMQLPESSQEGALNSQSDSGSDACQENPVANTRMLVPSDAHNNLFDAPAAGFFYRRCQELGVPLIVLSRFTAYGCPVQKFVYDLMVRVPIPHPTVCRLQLSQKNSIETLWQNVCAGEKLPPRCNKQWFCDTFCNGAGAERGSSDSMWELVKTFNMFDPLAILASLPDMREQFFEPTAYNGLHGTVHLNMGESQENCGILAHKVDALHDYMLSTWMRAAGRCAVLPSEGSQIARRPSQLDGEHMSAALTPMMTRGPEDLEQLNLNVLRLLDIEWPKLKNSSLLSTWCDRDTLMRSIGPEMRLVDPETIELLGRIPHFAEGKSITMEEAAEKANALNLRFFIEMFSHRWHSPYSPDDRHYNKARVLCEWAKYRRSMNFKTFYWIDYSCIDQSDIAPGVTMLPLYVSCCNNIICYDVPEYESRAWCRIERLLFTAFVAPSNEYVTPGFTHRASDEKMPSGELMPTREDKVGVPDPAASDAELSFPQDGELISDLRELCTLHWSKCWKDGLIDIVEQKVGLNQVRNLRYGATEIRMRLFS